MSYTYWLPDTNGAKKDYTTESNSIVIIGANGAGKSKLGAWIEQQSLTSVHRIGAQRSLNFKENTPLKNYDEAVNFVQYGTNSSDTQYMEGKHQRWEKNGANYTTTLLNDFDDILAAMIAKISDDKSEYFDSCRLAETQGREKHRTPNTIEDNLLAVWDDVFPHRKLRIKKSKVYAVLIKDGIENEYSANQMSDGERAVLYLAAQVLCAPSSKMLIIDEPEIHLHRSIMNRLWIALEKAREDCVFIYITHDTQFAALHSHADKIWVQDFDGTHWNLQKLVSDDLPEELLLDILGNRKNVLFVEGTADSDDVKLYSALYPNYYVVPCGNCRQVIERTKAFNRNTTLHHCSIYGIIDRDYRSDDEIEKYKTSKIYTINVSEVENLFLVEELVRWFASHMGKNADEVFDAIKTFVIDTKFSNMINSQICESVVAQIKYLLNGARVSNENETEAKTTLNAALASINYDTIKATEETRFTEALNNKDYKAVLRVFNKKQISNSVGTYFGIGERLYRSTILNLIKTNKKEEIVATLVSYLPTEIPR